MIGTVLSPSHLLILLVDMSIKALGLALLAIFLLGMGRVRSPALRHAAWVCVLFGMLGMPFLSLALPGVVLPILPGTQPQAVDTPATSAMDSAGAAMRPQDRAIAFKPEKPIRRRESSSDHVVSLKPDVGPQVQRFWPTMILLVYGAGVVIMLGRVLSGVVGCRRIVRGSQVVAVERGTEGCSPLLRHALSQQDGRILVSPRICVPLTLGWLRPRILLPDDWQTWCVAKREAVLAHELAHVERRDTLFIALGTLNQCLYWFHPLAWFVSKQLASLAERASDDRAITLTGKPVAYARCLMEFATTMLERGRRVGATSLSMAEGGDLGSRINLILDRGRVISSPLSRRHGLIVWAVAFGIVPTLAVMRVGPRALAKAEGPVAAESRAESKTQTRVTARGRVIGPDGRPVVGATIYMTSAWGYLKRPHEALECATSGPDGRFQFNAPKPRFNDSTVEIAAIAGTFGADWVKIPTEETSAEVTLKLVDDSVPITGQIVDLEGHPVQGATLRVMQINASPTEDLGPWLQAIQGHQVDYLQLEQEYLSRFSIALTTKVTTDAEGRFRLTGIGRNRLVRAQLDGPTIASQHLHMLTRPGKTIDVRFDLSGGQNVVISYYGSSFRHVAAPTKPIVGVVRDKDTKKPLAGITIHSHKFPNNPYHGEDLIETTTDAQGRYQLIGMPKGEGKLGPLGVGMILAVPGRGLPYLHSVRNVPESSGLDPVTVDFELKRGTMIEGRLTDKETGKPVHGYVEYFAMAKNPNLPDYKGFEGSFSSSYSETKEDGSYQIAGLPGPGLVAVVHQDEYLVASDRDDEFGTSEPDLATAPYHLHFPSNYSALARVEPANGIDTIKRDVTLDPGWEFTGRVVGPNGQPISGVRGFGLVGWSPLNHEEMRTAEFTVRGFLPHRPRSVFFQHPEQGLVGVVQPPKDKGESIIVQLKPGATVTGRLLDENGHPKGNAELRLNARHPSYAKTLWLIDFPGRFKTDSEGRFRITALVPGWEFRLVERDVRQVSLFLGTFQLGQTKDLGDVQMKQD